MRRYHDWEEVEKIVGWFTPSEARVMQEVVSQLSPGAKVVELGSFQGRSSVVIAKVLPPGSILYCIDHFKGSVEHQGDDFKQINLLANFKSNIEKHHVDDKIHVLVMDTLKAAKEFDVESVDLVFVDASHDYESVRADILSWYPKLKVGGLLICHDYASYWPGVIEAIDSLQLDGKVLSDSLWFHQKSKIIEECSTRSEQIVAVVEKEQNTEKLEPMLSEMCDIQLSILNKTNELMMQIKSIQDMLANINEVRETKNGQSMIAEQAMNDRQQLVYEDIHISHKKKRKKKHARGSTRIC